MDKETERALDEAEKAARLKETGGTYEKVDQALGVCSEWVRDESGEYRKDCYRCCYWDEADKAAVMCPEHLMRDARKLIREQKEQIESLQGRIRQMSKELVRATQREWNG